MFSFDHLKAMSQEEISTLYRDVIANLLRARNEQDTVAINIWATAMDQVGYIMRARGIV